MSLWLAPAPLEVNIGDRRYPIQTDFRISIRAEQLILSDTPEPDRTLQLLHLYYGRVPADIETACEQMLWFYTCGSAVKACRKSGGTAGGGRVMDYEADAGYIYAAFMQQYHIDLATAHLHWWHFRALLDGLSEDTTFMRIVGYRSMDVSKIKDKQQRKYYTDMQKLYALPTPRGEQDKLDAITQALLNGGDVQGMLG